MESKHPKIIAFGEVLWDVLPEGEHPGGAPANFAIHCSALGAEVSLISSVGRDARGERMMRYVQGAGVSRDLIQVHKSLPTGVVNVTVRCGEPRYEIGHPAAWDAIELTPKNIEAVRSAEVFYFGTLAQRGAQSHSALTALISNSRAESLRFLDINLRAPFAADETILSSLAMANGLKLNENELAILDQLLGLGTSPREALKWLAARFGLLLVALTRGERGSLVFYRGRIDEHPGCRAECHDAIGAGDSFTAALIASLLAGKDLRLANQFANEVAAYVTSRAGATPQLPSWLAARLLAE